jgi:transcriptional regulator with XRE-family HTH domain
MMDTKTLLGKRIRSLRRLNDLSQEQLSEQANISAKYIGEVERGKANLTIDFLERISITLNVDLPDLFDFHHELRRGELKKAINSLIKDANDQSLQIIFRVLKSILK